MLNPLDLSGRRILISGAASGIGRAAALLVSRLAGQVAALDQDEAGLKTTLAQLQGTGHTSRNLDLRQLAEIPPLMNELAANWGPLHGVVHAAGVPCVTPLRVLQPENYRDALAVNTEAGLALARGFQSRKVCAGESGSIVFIASVMGLVGSPTVAAYAMSKAALIGLTRSLALELAPRKIRVNCLAPGFVRTPMYDRVSKDWNREEEARVQALHPLGLGQAEDVAQAIVFLLADTSRWITGTVLTVDGGYTAQ